MKILSYISYTPQFLIMLITYYLMILMGVDFNVTEAVFKINLPSGVKWALTSSDLFIIFCLMVLFIEIIKSTRIGTETILEHGLSTILFIICLILFIFSKPAGTSTFLTMTLMSLLDSVAGFILAARILPNLNVPDYDVDNNNSLTTEKKDDWTAKKVLLLEAILAIILLLIERIIG